MRGVAGRRRVIATALSSVRLRSLGVIWPLPTSPRASQIPGAVAPLCRRLGYRRRTSGSGRPTNSAHMRVASVSNRGSSTSAGLSNRQRRRAPAPRPGPLPQPHPTIRSEAPQFCSGRSWAARQARQGVTARRYTASPIGASGPMLVRRLVCLDPPQSWRALLRSTRCPTPLMGLDSLWKWSKHLPPSGPHARPGMLGGQPAYRNTRWREPGSPVSHPPSHRSQ